MLDMCSEPSTVSESYKTPAEGSAVAYSFTDYTGGRPDSSSRQARTLAPKTDSVHEKLRIAVAQGQGAERLDYLIAQGADVDTKDKTNLGVLYYAAFRGDGDTVQFLLRAGADVNPPHDVLGTPIMIAALRGHTEVVKTLLQHKARFQMRHGVLGSAMHCAYFSGNVAIVECLTDTGASIHILSTTDLHTLKSLADESLSPGGIRLLPLAGLIGGPEQVPVLPHAHMYQQRKPVGSDWSKDIRVRCRPILLATECHHLELLQHHSRMRELTCEAPYNETFDNEIWSFQIPASGDPRDLQRLSETSHAPSYNSFRSTSGPSYAANSSAFSPWSFMGFSQPLHSEDNRLNPLLMWAAGSLHINAIEYALSTNGRVDRRDHSGRTCLHYAALPFDDANFGNVGACVRRLVEAGADLDAADSDGNTPLMMAVNHYHPALGPYVSRTWGSDIHVRCLAPFLGSAASVNKVNKKDPSEKSALLYAVSSSHCQPDSIKLLCEHGADLHAVNADGENALQIAQEYGAPPEVVSILLQSGAEPNTTNVERKVRPPLLVVAEQTAPREIGSTLLEAGANPGTANLWSPYGP